MNIAIVGTGYVGLVFGACFSEMEIYHQCIDIYENKITWLLNGDMPVYKLGLDDWGARNVKANYLHFTTDLTFCLDKVKIDPRYRIGNGHWLN